MFIPSDPSGSGATASTVTSTASSAHSAPLPNAPIPREQVRHILFGTPVALKRTIQHLHKLGYAEPNDWSRLLSTGRANEVMAILTKRVEVS